MAFDANQDYGAMLKCKDPDNRVIELSGDVKIKSSKTKDGEERGRINYTCKTPLPSWYTDKLDGVVKQGRCGRVVGGCVGGRSATVQNALNDSRAKQQNQHGTVLPTNTGDFHDFYDEKSYVDTNNWEAEDFTRFQVALYRTEPFTDWKCDPLTAKCKVPQFVNCGGTIVDTNTVLTAAHCIQRAQSASNPVTMYVVAGQHDMTTVSNHQQIREVKEFIVPKGIMNATKNGSFGPPIDVTLPYNDMAILKLDSPLKYTDFVGRACLPETGDKVDVGTTCFVSGWGKANKKDDLTSHKQIPSLKLRYADVKISSLNGETCFGRCDNICVGKQGEDQCTGARGSCQGDSGGPLICEVKKDNIRKAVLFGTVQGAKRCAGATSFSAVAPRLAMIRSAMETEESQKTEEKKEEKILETLYGPTSTTTKKNGATINPRRAKTIQFSNAIRFGTIFALGGV